MKTAISKTDMTAFTAKLQRLEPDIIDMVVGDVQDLCAFEDEVLRLGDLAKEIPESVRKRMVELSRQRFNALRQLEDIIEQLSTTAVRIEEKKRKDAEKSAPRCECCGHKLDAKKVRR